MTTYTHTTFAQAKLQLADLLGNVTETFWTDTELGLYIKESLRTWGLATGYWKATSRTRLSTGVAFYDLMSVCKDGDGNLVQSSTLTDRDVINDICYALMEPPIVTWSGGWIGTEQFTLDEITRSLQRSRDELLALTGITCTVGTYDVSAGENRIPLNQSVSRVLRVTINELGSTGQPLPLWEADEGQIQSTISSSYDPSSSRPKTFSTTYTPQLSLDLWPVPRTDAILTIYSVNRGPTLNPTASATLLGIPDDLAWILKYMVISDITGSDGIRAAPAISQYSQQRVNDALGLVEQYQSLLWASINNRRSPITSVDSIDANRTGWESSNASPRSLHLLNWNLFASYPPPDTDLDVAIEMVAKATVPSIDADFIQVSQDLMPIILGLAQHLAHMKLQGAELQSTVSMYADIMQRADTIRAANASKSLFYPTLAWRVKSNRWTVPFAKPTISSEVSQSLKET